MPSATQVARTTPTGTATFRRTTEERRKSNRRALRSTKYWYYSQQQRKKEQKIPRAQSIRWKHNLTPPQASLACNCLQGGNNVPVHFSLSIAGMHPPPPLFFYFLIPGVTFNVSTGQNKLVVVLVNGSTRYLPTVVGGGGEGGVIKTCINPLPKRTTRVGSPSLSEKKREPQLQLQL